MKTINQSILESLLKAKEQLSSEAVNLIKSFIESKLNESGGFIDRSGKVDPYYTVFGLTLSYVFDVKINVKLTIDSLDNWQKNNPVDFIHAVSLLRCYYLAEIINYKQKHKQLASKLSTNKLIQDFIASRIALNIRKKHKNLMLIVSESKSADGGFNHLDKEADTSNVYANFLAYGLFEDLRFNKKWRTEIAESCRKLMLENGAFVNHPKSEQGIGSTSAAGIILLYKQKHNVALSAKWIKNLIGNSGGFFAGENVPVSDVLTTATCLLALNIVGESSHEINTKANEFVSLHWDSSGGFFGSVADQIPDVEYTFYGLLTIGQTDF